MNKEKKKTLTISSSFKKKIDSGSFSKKENKKSYSLPIDKKNTFKANKNFRQTGTNDKVSKIKAKKARDLQENLLNNRLPKHL